MDLVGVKLKVNQSVVRESERGMSRENNIEFRVLLVSLVRRVVYLDEIIVGSRPLQSVIVKCSE